MRGDVSGDKRPAESGVAGYTRGACQRDSGLNNGSCGRPEWYPVQLVSHGLHIDSLAV